MLFRSAAKKSLLCKLALAACLWLVAQPARLAFSQIAVPEGPAGEALKTYLEAFNSGDRSKLEAWVDAYKPKETADDLLSFRNQTGGFTLLSIEGSAPDSISFRVKGRTDGIEAFGSLMLASTTPPKVKSLSIRALPPGAILENIRLDAASRQKVIDSLSAQLTEYYVYADVALKMNGVVQDHQRKGDYSGITDGNEFADALTNDLRSVSHDLHLAVRYNPYKLPAGAGPSGPHPPSPSDMDRFRVELQRRNCSFVKVEVLPRNIGYLKFDEFASPEFCGATVIAAMNFLAHVDAIIFDLRDNHGGDPRMVAYIATYLFDRSTHFTDIYDRKEDTTTQLWTSSYVPGARLANVPAFVLTSKGTFSGAEDFSYSLQALKRAIIVGETTGGGAHPVGGHPVGDHFLAMIPFARTVNPTTKTNWEGVGVKPDVPAPASQALEVAERLAEAKLQAHPSEAQ